MAALTLGAGLFALTLAGCTNEAGGTSPSSARPASASSSASAGASASASPSDPVAYAAQVLRETNSVRTAEGLPELGGSACAQEAALRRASDLVGAAKLTHAPLTDVIARCAPATAAAENLSRAAASPSAVLDAWMGSPGHRSNLLDPGLTEIGVGCVLDGDEMLCSQVYLGP